MYRSKLFDIVLNHRLISLDCADQHVVQMCPELTKFLPQYNWLIEIMRKELCWVVKAAGAMIGVVERFNLETVNLRFNHLQVWHLISAIERQSTFIKLAILIILSANNDPSDLIKENQNIKFWQQLFLEEDPFNPFHCLVWLSSLKNIYGCRDWLIFAGAKLGTTVVALLC